VHTTAAAAPVAADETTEPAEPITAAALAAVAAEVGYRFEKLLERLASPQPLMAPPEVTKPVPGLAQALIDPEGEE
jgi:hypothetical protein